MYVCCWQGVFSDSLCENMGTLQFKAKQRALREDAPGQTFLCAVGSMGERESGLGLRRVKGVECILACKTEGEAFFRD